MSDITTTNMDIDMDVAMSVPGSAVCIGTGGGLMSIFTDGVTRAEMPSLIQPNFNSPLGYHAAATLPVCVFTHDMDVGFDLTPSEPSQNLLVGPVGSVMSILLERPIRNNLSDLIEPGLIADNTHAQFTDIADIIATGMDVDNDLPMGASGAWGCLQTRSCVLLNGTIHWSFDQFASELKTQLDTEIEYISGSGIPKYVCRGENDPDAGVAGRDAEDFRFYDLPGELRIQQLALPAQWNEINMQMPGGHGNTLDILIAMFL